VADPSAAQDAATKNYVDTHGGTGTISDITSTGSSIAVGSPTGPTTNVDVAASGVTAGTYGDSTHTAQVHVGADGRVTSASNVTITGGAGGSYFPIGSTVLGADAASMSVGSIPATYTHLDVFVITRTDETIAAVRYVECQLSGDTTAANYVTQLVNGNSSAGSGTVITTQAGVSWQTDATGSAAGVFTMARVCIPLYANNSIHKIVNGMGGRQWGETGGTQPLAQGIYGVWKSTAAVTSVTITPNNAVNLKAGSALYVYGIA
jgi:hypothetical protein